VTAPDLVLEHLFNLHVKLQRDPERIGPTPEGLRINLFVDEGECVGPSLSGRLRSGGDWFMLRVDGVGVLDVRCTIETSDGALIFGEHLGLLEFGEHGYANLLRGERPTLVTGKVTARYHTGDARYAWLNRKACAASVQVDLKCMEVAYRVYLLS
jgi:hypothetical protein